MFKEFYGEEYADSVLNKDGLSVRIVFDVLRDVWCKETCAPRMQAEWSKENMTLGQCSITAFLLQDLFGGEVFGVMAPGNNLHLYNCIDNKVFDLTSSQFGNVELVYDCSLIQDRSLAHHFGKTEKYERYLTLKKLFAKNIIKVLTL